MTIFFSLDPRAMVDGVTMTSIGLEEYPAIKPDGSDFGDPAFTTSGGRIVNANFFGVICPPRVVRRLGSPIIRGEARFRLGQSAVLLFSPDARQGLFLERYFYGTTHALAIDHFIDYTFQRAEGFQYAAEYNGISTANRYLTLPSEVDVSWVVDGGDLTILVNGVPQRLRDFANGGFVDSIPIPPALLGSNGAGFVPFFHNNYAVPLVLRDNADLIYCTDVVPERFDDDTSRLVIDGICSKAASSQVNVSVRSSSGTLLSSLTTPVTSGRWQARTGQIAKTYEPSRFVCDLEDGSIDMTVTAVRSGQLRAGQVLFGTGIAPNATIQSQLSGSAGGAGVYRMSAAATQDLLGQVITGTSELRVTASNVGGAVEQRVVLAGFPRTLVKQEVRLGNNLDLLDYYTGWCPFHDLARVIQWRVASQYIVPAWVNEADFAASGMFTSFLPASTINAAPNGSPRKFPDNTALQLQAQLPWFPEPGDYVMDMSEAPNLLWTFSNTAGKVAVTLDHYGPKLHRVSISEKYIPTSTGDGWRINLIRDNSKPNLGMPTTEWTLTMRKAGSPGDFEWNDSFLGWIRESGMSHLRWMSGMMAAEEPKMPRNITTAAKRTKLTDQTWSCQFNARPQIPFELLVDLHNRTGKHMWLNLPRSADESYIREIFGIIRDELDPDLIVTWTMSNEVWNFAQRQIFSYRDDGLKRGLGKGRSCRANITNGSNVVDILTAEFGPVEVGQRIVGQGIPVDTFITGMASGTGRTGTYTMSNNASATLSIAATYDAAVYGGDADYDYSAVPNWSAGISVDVGDLVQSFNIYRARVAHTSVADPVSNTDWTKWDLVQSGDAAARRAHVEQILAVRAIIEDEIGGAGAYADRCRLVAETWEAVFETWLPTYLDWGNLRTHLNAICGATYFGNESPIFRWETASTAVRQAVLTKTGADRIAVWVDAAKTEAINVAKRHAKNALALVNALEDRGMAEGNIGYWTYEGGPEYGFALANEDLAATGAGPIDQTALRTDILAFHAAYHEDIVRAFYEAIFDVCGGVKTHFDSFTPTYYAYRSNGTGYLFWGVSRDMFDRAETSSKYRALRDLSVDYGEGEVVDPPPSARRRRQTLIIS
ncbi:hypothetical protein [Rhizorhabdus sp.]|uniref:hypothetical protein n=1 Tax=Rhizorhabdus sp. TaxID=1968843 RepID=UPI0035ADB19F